MDAIWTCRLAIVAALVGQSAYSLAQNAPTDRYSSYSDKDFRLGLNAAQTTLAAIAQLAGASLK
jgi:hypothetical protein